MPPETISTQTEDPVRSAIDLALEVQRLLDERQVNNRAEIAERYGISRARVTQVMNLLRLPPKLLRLLADSGNSKCNERQLRRILALPSQKAQITAARAIVTKPVQTASQPTLTP